MQGTALQAGLQISEPYMLNELCCTEKEELANISHLHKPESLAVFEHSCEDLSEAPHIQRAYSKQ
jgi:hypothetical protein